MPRVVTLRTQHFAVCGVESQVWVLGERLNVMYVQLNLSAAAITHKAVLNAALLAFVAVKRQRIKPPLLVFTASSKPHVLFMHTAPPMRVLVPRPPSALSFAQISAVLSGEFTARLLPMPAVFVVPQFDPVLFQSLPDDRFTNMIHPRDLLHGMLLIQRFQFCAIRLERPFWTRSPRLYPVSSKCSANGFLVDTVHLRNFAIGVKLVQVF